MYFLWTNSTWTHYTCTDCVSVEVLISVPTMQCACVMAAHWCHLYHMGGYKHLISNWETPSSVISTTIDRRFWCNRPPERSRSRFTECSLMPLDIEIPVLRGFFTVGEAAEWKQKIFHTAGEFLLFVSRFCDVLALSGFNVLEMKALHGISARRAVSNDTCERPTKPRSKFDILRNHYLWARAQRIRINKWWGG